MTQEELVKISAVCLLCTFIGAYASLAAWRWGLVRGFSMQIEIRFYPPSN